MELDFFTKILTLYIVSLITSNNYYGCYGDIDDTKPYPFYPPDYSDQLCNDSNSTYDFLVAGSGTGGSIVSARLSEIPDWTILLLEFGDDPPAYSYVPENWTSLIGTHLDYHYTVEKNGDFYQGFIDEKTSISAGKATGGSAAINGEYYFTPTRHDMDAWEAAGCDGWNYSKVKPYIIKAENFHDNELFDKRYHGSQGYQDVSRYLYNDSDIRVLGNGYRQMGLELRKDFNKGESNGYGSCFSSTVHGLRVSTARGYLSPISLRKNFHFARRVLVRKVLVDDRTKPVRAIGLEISRPNGKTCTVYAGKEVIISLGAIRTPQILMLSGIGPEEHLRQMGIPVKMNLPVGQDFKDHTSYLGSLLSRDSQSDDDDTSYLNRGLATAGIGRLNAFFNAYNVTADYDNLQIQLSKYPKGSLSSSSVNGHNLLYYTSGVKQDFAQMFTDINDKADIIQLALILVDVKSRGNVTLRNLDPAAYPKLYTAMLNDPEDLKTMVEGLKWIAKFADTPAVRESGYRLKKLDYPACRNLPDNTDAYYVCALKQLTGNFNHAHCTVKMGAEHDQNAPLNPNLKLKGFANLRVVDASAFPRSISRNINPTVIALAEKAADMIKIEHGQSTV